MALPPNGLPDRGPVQESGRRSLLDLADLDAGATRRRRAPRNPLTGLLGAGLALAGLLALVSLQIPQLEPAIRAGFGEGTRGEFTLQQYGCDRFSCTWTGMFAAREGRLTLHGVAFNGRVPSGARRGVAVPALYSGDRGTGLPGQRVERVDRGTGLP